MTGRGFGRALFGSPGGRSPPPLSPKDTPAAPFPGQTMPQVPARARSGSAERIRRRPQGPAFPQNSDSAGSAPCPEEVFSFLVFLYRLRRQRAPLLAPRPAGRSEHPPFPPPPAAGPGGAGLLPRRHGLLRASLFLNASCGGNAADARRDSLPGSGPSPPRPSRLCGADQTPSARPPRPPKLRLRGQRALS